MTAGGRNPLAAAHWAVRSAVRRLLLAPREMLILLVRLYKVTLSPLLGGQCRFTPTCSDYAIQALRRHGALRGSLKAIWRVMRCNPLGRGGYDPVD